MSLPNKSSIFKRSANPFCFPKHNIINTIMNILPLFAARGINMTVQEVAGLPTLRYTERVHAMHLSDDDMAFLKSLRRRIKNRVS